MNIPKTTKNYFSAVLQLWKQNLNFMERSSYFVHEINRENCWYISFMAGLDSSYVFTVSLGKNRVPDHPLISFNDEKPIFTKTFIQKSLTEDTNMFRLKALHELEKYLHDMECI